MTCLNTWKFLTSIMQKRRKTKLRNFCQICKYTHKERPESFCHALNDPNGLESLDHNEFMSELMEMQH